MVHKEDPTLTSAFSFNGCEERRSSSGERWLEEIRTSGNPLGN